MYIYHLKSAIMHVLLAPKINYGLKVEGKVFVHGFLSGSLRGRWSTYSMERNHDILNIMQ